MSSNGDNHGNGCCNCHPATTAVVQTLSEMDFERGIWNAVIYKEIDRVKDFIAHGQTNERDNSNYTALHYAARNGHEDICKILLQANADINATTNGGATPLHRAAMMGHHKIVKMLLQYNARCDIQDQDGQTALHRSATKGSLLSSQEILNSSKDLKYILDKKGNTPYDLVNPTNEELKNLLMSNDNSILDHDKHKTQI